MIHPDFPWITVRYIGVQSRCRCECPRTGRTRDCADKECIRQFAIENSESPGYVPLGTKFQRIAKLFGLKQCDACIRRQELMNRMVKR